MPRPAVPCHTAVPQVYSQGGECPADEDYPPYNSSVVFQCNASLAEDVLVGDVGTDFCHPVFLVETPRVW